MEMSYERKLWNALFKELKGINSTNYAKGSSSRQQSILNRNEDLFNRQSRLVAEYSENIAACAYVNALFTQMGILMYASSDESKDAVKEAALLTDQIFLKEKEISEKSGKKSDSYWDELLEVCQEKANKVSEIPDPRYRKKAFAISAILSTIRYFEDKAKYEK